MQKNHAARRGAGIEIGSSRRRCGVWWCSPLRRFRATARVAAPSVCYAVACILLAAAPTTTPCFRHWRRSSLLPLPRGASGEEIRLYVLPKPPLDRGGGIAPAMTERFSKSFTKICAPSPLTGTGCTGILKVAWKLSELCEKEKQRNRIRLF